MDIDLDPQDQRHLKSLHAQLAKYKEQVKQLKVFAKKGERKRLEIRRKFIDMAFKLDMMNAKGLALIKENVTLLKKTDSLKFEIRMLEEKLQKSNLTGAEGTPNDNELRILKAEKEALQASLQSTLREKTRVTSEMEDLRTRLKELRLQIMREDKLVRDRQSHLQEVEEAEETLDNNFKIEGSEHKANTGDIPEQSNQLFMSFKEQQSSRENLARDSKEWIQDENQAVQFDQEFEDLLMTIKKKTMKIEQLWVQINEEKKKFIDLNSQFDLLKEKFKKVEKEMQDLEEKVKVAEEERDDVETRLDNCEIDLKKITFEKNKLDFRIKEGEAKLGRKEKELQGLRGELEKINKENEEKEERRLQEIREKDDLFKANTEAIEESRHNLKEFETKNRELTGRLNSKREEIGNALEFIMQQEGDIYLQSVYNRAIEEQLVQHSGKAKILKLNLNKAQQKQDSLKKKVKNLKQNLVDKMAIINNKSSVYLDQREMYLKLQQQFQKLKIDVELNKLHGLSLNNSNKYMGKKARKTHQRRMEEKLVAYEVSMASVTQRLSLFQGQMSGRLFEMARKVANLTTLMTTLSKLCASKRASKSRQCAPHQKKPSQDTQTSSKSNADESEDIVNSNLKSSFSRILQDFTNGEVSVNSENLYDDFALYYEEKLVYNSQNLKQESLTHQIRNIGIEQEAIILGAEKTHVNFQMLALEEKVKNIKEQYANLKKAYKKLKEKYRKACDSKMVD